MIWIPRIFIAMGLVFLAIFALALVLAAGKGGAAKATGTVVRFEMSGGRSSNGGSGPPLFCPVVRFVTADGREIELTASTCSRPAAYDIGESVEVDYDPAAPEDAAFGGFFTRHLVALVFGVIGLVFSVVGIALRGAIARRLRKA